MTGAFDSFIRVEQPQDGATVTVNCVIGQRLIDKNGLVIYAQRFTNKRDLEARSILFTLNSELKMRHHCPVERA